MMPGVVLRPGQIVTTALGLQYRLLAKRGDDWSCELDGEIVYRTPGFLRRHGVRLEWECNERKS